MALNFTLPKRERYWRSGSVVDTCPDTRPNKHERHQEATDLALILGAFSHQQDDCPSWTVSVNKEALSPLTTYGELYHAYGTNRTVAIRPIMDSEVLPCYKKMEEPTEFEYGEYPQMETDKDTSAKLEKLFQEKSLKLTGKTYTFDSVDPCDFETEFQPEKCPEYLYEGKKYIRVLARQASPYTNSILTKGWKQERIEKGKPYWVEVQPIKWWKDIDGVWISQKALLGGIQLNSTKEHDWDDFDKKFMKRYLDTYFAKEIEPSKTIERTKSKKGLTALLSEQDREEIEKDDDVVRLRKERKDKIEQALKGTEKLEGKEKRKAELAILRKTNVQTLRDAEGKARAKKTAEILKKKQRTK